MELLGGWFTEELIPAIFLLGLDILHSCANFTKPAATEFLDVKRSLKRKAYV